MDERTRQKKIEQDQEFVARAKRMGERRKIKQAKKEKLGMLGKLISFVDSVKSRTKKNVVTIEDSFGYYGRAGNRIYLRNETGHYVIFKKCKNATKAKKFMQRIRKEN